MSKLRPVVVALVLLFTLNGDALTLSASAFQGEPLRNTVVFDGVEREYFVRLPRDFDRAKTYWLAVAVHGAGADGRTFFMADGVRAAADEMGLEAIVIAPTFSQDTPSKVFPTLGEGAFLRRVIEKLNSVYRLKPKILLTGYSGGGQFSHRFCLWNPELVAACAPFSGSNWSTPDGRLLVDGLGEIRDPSSFLASRDNAKLLPERRRYLFDPRVPKVAGIPPSAGAREIPFLVMCGTLDPRLFLTREFVRSLEIAGYEVETDWPRTVHWSDSPEFRTEFERYSRRAVEFFLRVSKGN